MIRAALLVLMTTSIAGAEPVSSAEARRNMTAPDQSEAFVSDVGFLSSEDKQVIATLKDAMPFYGALALSPSEGLYADWVNAATQFHTRNSARAAAMAHCETSKASGSEPCQIVLEVAPVIDDYDIKLSAPAIAAFFGPFQRLAPPRAFAVSDATGAFAFADSAADALGACNASEAAPQDCRVVVLD